MFGRKKPKTRSTPKVTAKRYNPPKKVTKPQTVTKAKPVKSKVAKAKPAKVKKPPKQVVKAKAVASAAPKGRQQTVATIRVNLKRHRDNQGNHPHVIMGNIDNNHVSVGLTTKKKKGLKGGTNYTMEKSPFDDGKQSYMRRQGTVDDIKNYYSPTTGQMSKADYNQAKVYSDRAKQKYLDKKNKKSSKVPNTTKGISRISFEIVATVVILPHSFTPVK